MINIRNNVLIKNLTTIKVGGIVKYFIEVESTVDIVDAMSFIKNNKLNYFIIGNGSNVLINDKYFDGCVIYLNKKFSDIFWFDNYVEVYSGCLLSTFINRCRDKLFSCLEKLYGIPGTIGGSVYGNAGSNGFSISDRVISVKVYEDGTIKEYSKDECGFGYRDSVFKNKNCIILSVKFKVNKCNKSEIDYCITKGLRDKKEKQPVSSFSFGCTFKNIGNISSWKYIKEVEKLIKQGENVCISDKHASFIINRGEGSIKEVYNLIESIKNSVYYIYNIKLCDEVEIIDWR